MCRVLGSVMNALMDSEAQQMRREPQRAQRRQGEQPQRLPPQSLKTAVGDVELEIPKLRHGTYYPEGMLARWSRVDTSVASIVQEMYVCGVSTRKVERVASKLGISSLSSSEVSSLCSDLDAEVDEFRRRDLSGTPCCYLWLGRHLHELQGRLVGRLAGRRDRDRAGRRRAQALPRAATWSTPRARTPGRHSSAGCASAGWPAFASWSPTATPGSWPPSRACSGLRPAALRDAPAAQPPERLLGQARGPRRPSGDLVHAAVYQTTLTSRAAWGRGGAPGGVGVRRAGEVFEQAEDSALAFTAFP